VLFGIFPTFRASPLRSGWDRVVQMGDASGIQSPLSFGGFGALTRHIGRLVGAYDEALKVHPLPIPVRCCFLAYASFAAFLKSVETTHAIYHARCAHTSWPEF
jgi:hypothetical protein